MRRSQQFLIAVGTFIFALGASVALLAAQLSTPHVEAAAALPVAEECLNCHSEEYRAVERAVQPMSIFSAQPDTSRVIPIGVRTDGLAVVPMGSDTRPYLVTAAHPEEMGEPELQYLLRTDRGEAVLADNWHAIDRALQAAGPDAAPLCEACHLLTPTAPARAPESGL
jgi:hypothetical protein